MMYPSPNGMSFAYTNPLLEKFGLDFFQGIPRRPGVYFMHHPGGDILYIGKAKDLRNRLAWYKNAKPGQAHDHTLELLENISHIRWEEHPTEAAAILRESELLHAVKPPYNIAGTWPQDYLYIGTKSKPLRAGDSLTGQSRLEFQLTSRREMARDYRLFGCFKHRRRTKTGYTALLRLLHAAAADPTENARRRFGFPARITRASPPYLYALNVPTELVDPLERFLAGRSSRLLGQVVDKLLANENIPRFMHHGLQDDLQLVQDFYRVGPHATFKLKRLHGVKSRLVSHRRMNDLLKVSALATIESAMVTTKKSG
jgi:excinuclease UvrABC nuclease subunit